VLLALCCTRLDVSETDAATVGPPRLSTDGYRRRHLVSAGEALRLGCPVDSDAVGRSAPIITWYKDGDEVSVGWERYRVRHDALFVRDMEPDDSGVYVCRATNGFGSVDVKYLVLVLAGQSHLRQHAVLSLRRSGGSGVFIFRGGGTGVATLSSGGTQLILSC